MSVTTEKLDFLDHMHKAIVLAARCQEKSDREAKKRIWRKSRQHIAEVNKELSVSLRLLESEYQRVGDLPISMLPDDIAPINNAVRAACAELTSYLVYLHMEGLGVESVKRPSDSINTIVVFSNEIH